MWPIECRDQEHAHTGWRCPTLTLLAVSDSVTPLAASDCNSADWAKVAGSSQSEENGDSRLSDAPSVPLRCSAQAAEPSIELPAAHTSATHSGFLPRPPDPVPPVGLRYLTVACACADAMRVSSDFARGPRVALRFRSAAVLPYLCSFAWTSSACIREAYPAMCQLHPTKQWVTAGGIRERL